jgi:hypothetical protein
MANPIIKIKRGTTVPSAGQLQAGEFAIDQAAKNLYLGVEVAGVVTNEIVGGNGTFATHTDVANAVTSATGALGTMSTQNANAVNITGGTIDGTTIGATTPSTGYFTSLQVTSGDLLMTGGNIDMNSRRVLNLPAPVNANEAVRKTDLDSAISALGDVFHFVGNVSSASTPLDLSTLSDTNTGAYYKVDVAGAYTDGATTFNAKVGDAFVKTTTGWQKLDNVDVEVLPTANEISVSGTEDTGYTVSIDPVFSGRVTTLETKTQNIDLAGTTAGTTHINGTVKIANTGLGGGAALLTGNDIGINIAASDGTLLAHAGLWYGDSAFVGSTNKMVLQGGTEVEVRGTAGGMPAEATLVTLNSAIVSGNAAGTTTLENFVIDGGTY